jgi:hypothetical protein
MTSIAFESISDPCSIESTPALGAVGVRRDLEAVQLRLGNDGAQLLVRVLLRADRTLEAHDTGGGADLDYLGAVLDLVPDGLEDLVLAIGDAMLGSDFEHAGRATRHVAVSARDADRMPGRNDTRAVDVAALDRVLERDIGEPGRADVAHGREAAHQRQARVPDAEQRAIGVGPVDATRLPAFAQVRRQVRVRVDQAGHQCLPRQLDHVGACRQRRRIDGLDAIAAHDDDSGRDETARLDVDVVFRAQNLHRGRYRGIRRNRCQ